MADGLPVDAGTPRRWLFRHYARPWTMNTERTWKSPYKRAAVTKEWRSAWYILGLTEPTCSHLERVRIFATPLVPENGARRQDVAACFPAVKAAIDGLTDAGMCVNDGPKHVISLTFNVQRPGGRSEGLELVVVEVL